MIKSKIISLLDNVEGSEKFAAYIKKLELAKDKFGKPKNPWILSRKEEEKPDINVAEDFAKWIDELDPEGNLEHFNLLNK